jgi:hypothetical protein
MVGPQAKRRHVQAPPRRELQSSAPFVSVPSCKFHDLIEILLMVQVQLEVPIPLPCVSQNAPNARSAHERCIELRDMLKSNGIDALGLARITSSRAQIGEAKVRGGARRVELESFGIASDGTVFLMGRLELTGLPQKVGHGRSRH